MSTPASQHLPATPPVDPHALPNFDRIAGPYRLLERLTLGRSLEHCREHFLPRLSGCRRALVLGDGDGRFLARLLAQNPKLHADAVDLSPAMLRVLKLRCAPHGDRLATHQADALHFTPPPTAVYDLVVTHFFLDCLTDLQLSTLTERFRPCLTPDALWLVSDFRIPPSGPMRLPARLLVRSLYLVFRLLTGLRIKRLPDHVHALHLAGLQPLASHLSLFGLLTTELWTACNPEVLA